MVNSDQSSRPEPLSFRHFKKPIAIGTVIVAGLVGVKGCSDTMSANSGELQPANYLCLDDEARGRSEPHVPDKYDGDNLRHVLDLSGTPEEGGEICFPTSAGTVRVDIEKNNGRYVPDEWYEVPFGEVQNAVENEMIVNRATGKPASDEAAHRFEQFASNWPIDILGARHTWVNGARASIVDTVTPEK